MRLSDCRRRSADKRQTRKCRAKPTQHEDPQPLVETRTSPRERLAEAPMPCQQPRLPSSSASATSLPLLRCSDESRAARRAVAWTALTRLTIFAPSRPSHERYASTGSSFATATCRAVHSRWLGLAHRQERQRDCRGAHAELHANAQRSSCAPVDVGPGGRIARWSDGKF